jgi:hypothetical protein
MQYLPPNHNFEQPDDLVRDDLDSVSGLEALATYPEFYKWFVQRKKNELVNPRFVGISEIVLPRSSLIHFFPKNPEDLGPSNSEAFISNFPEQVFIDFVTKFEPVIGSGRSVAMEINKVIKGYRASHYNYNWTRDIGTVYNKDKVLIVKNYGLVEKLWLPRPTMFVNFERHYNRYNMLMEHVNEEAEKNKRKQYLRVDLPMHMPAFLNLMADYDHYVESFKEGLPHATNQTVRSTKAESSYWLMDMMAYLLGDYEYSLFNKLTPAAVESFHLIFVFNSRSLIIHLGTLKSWLDELSDNKWLEKKAAEREKALAKAEKDGKPLKEEHQSDRAEHPKRLNVTKRVYLALMNLTRGGVSEEEVVKEEAKDEAGKGTSEDPNLAEGAKGTSQGEGKKSDQRRDQSVSGKDAPVAAPNDSGSILDVFTNHEGANNGPDETSGTQGDRGDTESHEEWTAAVDDSLLEQETVVAETSVAKDPFPTPESGVEAALRERAAEGVLTVAEQAFFMRKAEKYKTIKMDNGQTLEEFIKIKPEELKALKSDATIVGDFPVIMDESMLQSRAKVLKSGYVEKFLHKDTVKMFIAIQNAGIAMNDFKHEVVTGVEGTYDVYNIQLHPVNGDQTTHPIRIPRVQADGSFMVDGVKTHLQLQRMEIPIRKINRFKVALTSYYDRKLMVSRSQKVVDDLSIWMTKQIMAKPATALTYNRGISWTGKLEAPRLYSILANKFQWITSGDYTLDFRIDKLLADHPEFKKYTKPDSFLIGVKDGKPIVLDGYGNLSLGDAEFNTLEGLLGINTSKAPTEYAVINIGGYLFPMGVVLCFYFGIDELIKVTKATTRTVPMGTRPKLSEDEYAIAFNDEYLIFNRREKVPALIFGGMPKLNNISNFSRSDLNNKGIWGPLMGDAKVKPTHFQEMKNLYDLFIDPITKEELARLGYADSFHHLLIDAVKLLERDQTKHEVELEEQRIVGYERFAGHLYRELIKAVRMYRNKGKGRKQKIDLNPEAVIMSILTDTSVNLVEEVNPIHQLKDQEEVTFGGVGGRSEITMVQRARVQLASYKGVISEANKDSGKVGFVTYLTSDPRIDDYRGNIALKEKTSLTGLNSVTGNLAFGMSRDDPKRGMFTSTQASQAVSAANYSPNITRTGYEYMIAHRTSELYSKVAKEEGKVTAVTDDMLEITYKDNTVETYPLGLAIGEASGEYHRHTRVTDLKVGDKFKKGEVVGWDEQWFARDPFCPGQVAWKAGRMVRIALVEDQDTYEDSIAISKELAMESVTPFIKVKRFSIDAEQIINWKVKVGDSVDYDAILCEVEDDHLGDEGGKSDNTLMEDVNRLGIKQVRSNHHGKVIKIDVIYNSPKEGMSDGVAKFIAQSDKERKRKSAIDGSGVESGSVTNSLNVNKPVLSPGKVLFTVSIESMDPSTTADKYVIGNQMKGTVGSIFSKPLMTKDGRRIDVKSSFKGMFNRMVLSLRDKLGSNELAIQFTQLAVKVYRGK